MMILHQADELVVVAAEHSRRVGGVRQKLAQVRAEKTVQVNTDTELGGGGGSSFNNTSKSQSQPPQERTPTNQRQKMCSPDQLDAIRKALPSEDCIKHKREPWGQECSYSQQTKCPDAVWIDDYYRQRQTMAERSDSFIGISIGCNKGFDAINTMRMGSSDAVFDKTAWREQLYKEDPKAVHKEGVCGQDSSQQFDIDGAQLQPHVEMHCIEPMPYNAKILVEASTNLGLDQRGFRVVRAAVSKQNGSVLFPSGGHLKQKAGKESKGIGNCEGFKGDTVHGRCREVPSYTLDHYVENFVSGGSGDSGGVDDHDASNRVINILSIDVEGYDCDVLRGGQTNSLRRTEYLEFEYNWMGSWAHEKLSDIVIMLDDIDFTCYWAGAEKLWRITGCFFEHYDTARFWSNVACANRRLVPDLAEQMEDLFVKTIS